MDNKITTLKQIGFSEKFIAKIKEYETNSIEHNITVNDFTAPTIETSILSSSTLILENVDSNFQSSFFINTK